MKRTKPLLSNLLFVSRNEIQLRRRTSEKFVQVLVVKPQFDAGWCHGFTIGSTEQIRTLQREITTEWYMYP